MENQTTNSKKIIAIECRSIEDKAWGVGRSTAKFLEEIYKNPEMADDFQFILYFHRKIPDFEFLNSPKFSKKVLCPGIFKYIPFYIYYFVLVPIISLLDGVYITYYPNYMLPIIHLGKSIVVLTEDVYQEARNKNVKLRHRLAYLIFATWASWFATKIMAVSETSKIEVSKLFKINPKRIFANAHGVDFSKNIAGDDMIIRDPNLYMTLGQAFPRRHMKEIFEAFDKLAEENSKIKLIAIGVDKYNPHILKEKSDSINLKHGRQVINYKEYISDKELHLLYKEASYCLYISFNEAFGIPPVEALANGCVPIIANTEVSHEIFQNNAFFINQEHSWQNIFETIFSAQNNIIKKDDILKYKEKIMSKYTWIKHAERLIYEMRKI